MAKREHSSKEKILITSYFIYLSISIFSFKFLLDFGDKAKEYTIWLFIVSLIMFVALNCFSPLTQFLHNTIEDPDKKKEWRSGLQSLSTLLIPVLCSGIAGISLTANKSLELCEALSNGHRLQPGLACSSPNVSLVIAIAYVAAWIIISLMTFTLIPFFTESTSESMTKKERIWDCFILFLAPLLIFLPPLFPMCDCFPSHPLFEVCYLIFSGLIGGIGMLLIWCRVNPSSDIGNKVLIKFLIFIIVLLLLGMFIGCMLA